MHDSLLSAYEPKCFFHWFEEVSAIPRPSFHEEKIVEFMRRFAEERKLCCEIDEAGNVLMTLPASPGYEAQPSILLQGHMDMVCVKDEGVEHDFMTDPIKMRLEDDILYGCGTTLGADNAVALATMLSIADDSTIPHPPLELLFTVAEERGLYGIRHFDMGRIKSRRMVNIDCGYSHEMCICGAGSVAGEIHRDYPVEAPASQDFLTLRFFGGQGGHTGIRIHLGRACCANLSGELLRELQQKMPVQLGSFGTSSMLGSIISNFTTTFAVPAGRGVEAVETLRSYWESIRHRFAVSDPGVQCEVSPAGSESVLCAADSRNVISALHLFHTGAQKHDGVHTNFVISSSSINPSSLKAGKLELDFRIRSVDNAQREMLFARYTDIAALLGMDLVAVDRFPGWPPIEDSPLQLLFKKHHRRLFSEEIVIDRMHAGIEAGLIVGALPDMDAVGISPTSTNAHTTDETLHCREVKPFWDLLLAVLADKE